MHSRGIIEMIVFFSQPDVKNQHEPTVSDYGLEDQVGIPILPRKAAISLWAKQNLPHEVVVHIKQKRGECKQLWKDETYMMLFFSAVLSTAVFMKSNRRCLFISFLFFILPTLAWEIFGNLRWFLQFGCHPARITNSLLVYLELGNSYIFGSRKATRPEGESTVLFFNVYAILAGSYTNIALTLAKGSICILTHCQVGLKSVPKQYLSSQVSRLCFQSMERVFPPAHIISRVSLHHK